MNGRHSHSACTEIDAHIFEFLTLHIYSLTKILYLSSTFHDVIAFYIKKGRSAENFVKIYSLLFKLLKKINIQTRERHSIFLAN